MPISIIQPTQIEKDRVSIHRVERVEAMCKWFEKPSTGVAPFACVELTISQEGEKYAHIDMFASDRDYAEILEEAIGEANDRYATLMEDIQTPASDAAKLRGCSCEVRGVNGDPDQDVRVDKWCPLHGKDPDHALDEMRESVGC